MFYILKSEGAELARQNDKVGAAKQAIELSGKSGKAVEIVDSVSGKTVETVQPKVEPAKAETSKGGK